MHNLSTIHNLIREFYPFAKQRFGFQKPVRLFLRQDPSNEADVLGRTAHYNPADMSITIYISGRHPKDILRSFAHELVHHKQNCEGSFKNMTGEMGEGYAQKNEVLREMEGDAYLNGNLALRDWEDARKKER